MADLKLEVLLQAMDKASAPLRRVSAAGAEAGKALGRTRDALRALEQQQRRMEGMKALKRDLAETKIGMQVLAQQATQLNATIAAGGPDAAKAATALKRVTRETDRLKLSQRERLEKLRQLRAELIQTGVHTRNFASEEKRLQGALATTTARLNQQKEAYRQNAIQQQRMQQMRATRSQVGGQLLGAAALVAAAGYGAARVIDPGNEFEYQMQLIGNTADMTSAQIADLRAKIMAASEATGQSAARIQHGIGFLVAAGLQTDVAARSIAAIGRTTTAAGADLEDVSRAAFTLIDSLNVKPEGLQKALDILAQAGKEGNVELKDMAKQLPVLGAGFQALKMGGNDATATLGAALEIARKGAADPDEAANNMRNYLAKVMSPTTLQKAKASFGLDLYKVIQDAQSSGGNPFEASVEAVMKATGGDVKKLGEMFTDMQVQNFLKPVMANWGEYQRIKAKSLAASGVTDRDFDKMMQNAKLQLEAAWNAVGRLGLAINKTLKPAFAGIAAAATPLLARMTAFVDKHPVLVSSVVKAVVALVSLRIALLGVRYAWTFLGGGLITRGIGRLRTFAAASRASAIGARAAMLAVTGLSLPVVLLGAALVAVAFLVWKYWAPIKAFFIGVGRGISDVVGPAFAEFKDALAPLKPVWDGIAVAIGKVWGWIQQLFGPFQATTAQIDGATASGVTFGHALGYWLSAPIKLVTWLVQAFVGLGTAIGTGIGMVVVYGGKAIDWLGTAWSTVGEALKAPFITAFKWISDKFDWLIEKWRKVRGLLPGGDDASGAGKAPGWAFNDGRVPPPRFDRGAPLRAPGASKGAGSVTTYAPTIVQQPGESSDALSRRILAGIKDHERAKAASSRSALADAE